MTLDRLNLSDATLAFGLAVLGMAGIAVGWLTSANPFVISPGLDGTLTMVQLGFVLALFHGLGYRKTLSTMLPLLSILVIAALFQRESPWALVGVTLMLYGIVGLGVTMLTESPRSATTA